MKNEVPITQEEFDALLAWLAPDREQAGIEYENIRRGLIRYFRFRGCDDAESLSDEAINRVAKRLSNFEFHENIKTITYFYSFASKIYLEEKRRIIAQVQAGEKAPNEQSGGSDDFENSQIECLEKCLEKLPRDKSKLLIDYYSKEKSEKFARRKVIAENMNIKVQTLHTQVHRLKSTMRECIKKCLDKK